MFLFSFFDPLIYIYIVFRYTSKYYTKYDTRYYTTSKSRRPDMSKTERRCVEKSYGVLGSTAVKAFPSLFFGQQPAETHYTPLKSTTSITKGTNTCTHVVHQWCPDQLSHAVEVYVSRSHVCLRVLLCVLAHKTRQRRSALNRSKKSRILVFERRRGVKAVVAWRWSSSSTNTTTSRIIVISGTNATHLPPLLAPP